MCGATLPPAAKRRKSAKQLCLALMAALLLCGCAPETPPDADTPEPPAHDGVFRSEFGMLSFSDDGEHVAVCFADCFAEAAGLPQGERRGTYVFKFQNGAYRYDRADTFELYLDGCAFLFQNRRQETNETAICLVSPVDARQTIRFEKQTAREE